MIFLDWILIKQIYNKMNFIKDDFQRFRQQFKSTSNWLFLEVYILFHTKNPCFWLCLQNLSWSINHFLKMLGKLWIVLTACNFNENDAFPQVFFCRIFKTKYFLDQFPTAAYRNVTKYAVSHQYEQCDGILVYNGIFL